MQLPFLFHPSFVGNGSENMAYDLLLLEGHPVDTSVRFRQYDWSEPTWSFGFRQQLDCVYATLSEHKAPAVVRRPTAGGIVDHRSDWTYALVLPPSHPVSRIPARQSYRAIHLALIDALKSIGIHTELATACTPTDTTTPGQCFQRAECEDVVCAQSRRKIAGAAQKRTRQGLLVQGSVNHPALRGEVRITLQAAFIQSLTQQLCTRAAAATEAIHSLPRFKQLCDHFASTAWTTRY